MKITSLLLGLVFASVCFGQNDSIENGWKGIKVVQTSRTEVEKLLGEPLRSEYGKTTYKIEQGLIHVLYSNEPCSDLNAITTRYNIPKDTVLKYDVILVKELKVTDFHFKNEDYAKTEDRELIYNYYYLSQQDGITISTKAREDGEYVTSIDFFITNEMYNKYLCKQLS